MLRERYIVLERFFKILQKKMQVDSSVSDTENDKNKY